MTEEQTETKTDFEQFMALTPEQRMEQLRELSFIIKILDGGSVDAQEDLISFNTNLKDIKERTRFLTFPILKENVYFRLMADLFPEIAKSGKDYADLIATSLISYKGLGREEFRDIRKAASPETTQDTVIGSVTNPPQQQPKKPRFSFLRGSKQESEFNEQ